MSGYAGVDDGGVCGWWAGVDKAVDWGGQPGAELDCGEGGQKVGVGFAGGVGDLLEGVEVEGHLVEERVWCELVLHWWRVGSGRAR